MPSDLPKKLQSSNGVLLGGDDVVCWACLTDDEINALVTTGYRPKKLPACCVCNRCCTTLSTYELLDKTKHDAEVCKQKGDWLKNFRLVVGGELRPLGECTCNDEWNNALLQEQAAKGHVAKAEYLRLLVAKLDEE